jgi:amino acid transporter
LLVASQDGSIPAFFQKTNRQGMPVTLLVCQAGIVTLLSLLFLFMPTVNSSYWVLSVMAAQLALLYYILLFAAAIWLRYKEPDVPRAFKIPGGKVGVWLVCGLGILCCVAVIIFGFLPPPNIPIGNLVVYEAILFLGIILACVIPLVVYRFRYRRPRVA